MNTEGLNKREIHKLMNEKTLKKHWCCADSEAVDSIVVEQTGPTETSLERKSFLII